VLGVAFARIPNAIFLDLVAVIPRLVMHHADEINERLVVGSRVGLFSGSSKPHAQEHEAVPLFDGL
jgi:hypothetical protein